MPSVAAAGRRASTPTSDRLARRDNSPAPLLDRRSERAPAVQAAVAARRTQLPGHGLPPVSVSPASLDFFIRCEPLSKEAADALEAATRAKDGQRHGSQQNAAAATGRSGGGTTDSDDDGKRQTKTMATTNDAGEGDATGDDSGDGDVAGTGAAGADEAPHGDGKASSEFLYFTQDAAPASRTGAGPALDPVVVAAAANGAMPSARYTVPNNGIHVTVFNHHPTQAAVFSVRTSLPAQFTVKILDGTRVAPGDASTIVVSLRRSLKSVRLQTRFLVQWQLVAEPGSGEAQVTAAAVKAKHARSPRGADLSGAVVAGGWRGRNLDLVTSIGATVLLPCVVSTEDPRVASLVSELEAARERVEALQGRLRTAQKARPGLERCHAEACANAAGVGEALAVELRLEREHLQGGGRRETRIDVLHTAAFLLFLLSTVLIAFNIEHAFDPTPRRSRLGQPLPWE